MSQLLTYAVEGSVARLTLDSPHNRNALSTALVEQLHDVTRFRAVDGSHRVVVAATGFDPGNADAIIERELAHHRALGGVGFEWTVYGHHAPSNMVGRLERHGRRDRTDVRRRPVHRHLPGRHRGAR